MLDGMTEFRYRKRGAGSTYSVEEARTGRHLGMVWLAGSLWNAQTPDGREIVTGANSRDTAAILLRRVTSLETRIGQWTPLEATK